MECEYKARLANEQHFYNQGSPFPFKGAAQGKESVLADSGRESEITARVGRVRTRTFLIILKNTSPTRLLQITLIFKPLAT